MVIKEEILHSVGASIKTYKPTEIIFSEGDPANYYYQIITGDVKLNNYNKDGKESIQTLLEAGQSIGESMLFINKPYPMNAIAITNCEILRLPRHIFLDLLKLYPEISRDINTFLSQRIYYALVMKQNLNTHNPVSKLKTLMDYLKSFQKEQAPYSFLVPLTRQQMAGLTGLCVETAIRTIKVMERNKILKIKDRKILY
ncbi:cAMP-binding domain of CRP or a regulatory subunit of cAMP-dependent protein kinases [Chryseobacterium wanjuense]|jgi:CRP-like cAMP-binding protein|uniref:cAMP-binding domain of CRP or a regulatory subunit of cAMP-dependent protein kinases n=1 Tax=Chryseobacterium wanjuense TaxID=356305 RepID=A0A1I0PRW6_9FLAO|nr:Crp/Fnr family transcriptional regulator [Chryseobacterium wanjuense]SEW16618.1 cAMP-binding domain of CRP or a regulatory subunit of cAMP-dependent protein kinases [Chryseobacterium wanjuense]